MISFNRRFTKAFLLLMMLIISLASCKTDSNKIDDKKQIIPEGKFVKIMIDVRIAESIIRKQSSIGNDPKTLTLQLYNSIFEKYNISQQDFESSVKAYAQDPDKMYEINEKVVEALSKKEAEVKAQKSIEPSKK